MLDVSQCPSSGPLWGDDSLWPTFAKCSIHPFGTRSWDGFGAEPGAVNPDGPVNTPSLPKRKKPGHLFLRLLCGCLRGLV